MSETIVTGLHPGETALRLATLRRTAGRIEVNLSYQPMPKEDAPATQPEVVVGGDGVLRVAAVPGRIVMSRCWAFPPADVRTMRQMVGNRLEADLPIPVSQMTWGYRPGPRPCADGTIPVFVQAARTEQVARFAVSIARAGLPADIVTTDAEALQGLYRFGLDRPIGGQVEALVLAGAPAWLVAVFRDGQVQSVQRLVPRLEQPDSAVRECCQAIESQVDGPAVQRVFWIASAALDRSRACLAEQMHVPVESCGAAKGLTLLGAAADELAEYGPAIGLALAGLHDREQMIRLAESYEVKLSPAREQLQRLLAQPKRWALWAAALTLAALVLHVGALWWEAGRMRSLLAEADKAAVATPELPAKLQAMQRLQTYRIDVEKIVGELARAIPDTIVISSIRLSRDRRMVIKGTAKDPKAVFSLADALRKCSRFSQVNPERAEPGQGGGFTISMEVAGMHSWTTAGAKGGGTWQ